DCSPHRDRSPRAGRPRARPCRAPRPGHLDLGATGDHRRPPARRGPHVGRVRLPR
ncbi:MAG: hypothetical protein AVDCRST_MAG69-1097, partial [uncultured Solirubrobacteraceae bacterium]